MLKKVYSLSNNGVKNLWKGSIWTALHNLSTMLPVVLLAFLARDMINKYQGNMKEDISLLLYFGAAGILILMIFFIYKKTYHETYITSGSESADIRTALAEKIRKLPLSYIGNKDLSDLTSTIMDDASTVEKALSSGVTEFLGGIISSIIILFILFLYQWKMALSLSICLPIALLVVFLSKMVSTRANWKLRNRNLDVSEKVQEYLENIKIIQSSPQKEVYEKELYKTIKRVIPNSILYEFVSGTFVSIAYNVLRLGIGFVIITGSYMFTHGELNLFDFIFFIFVAVRIYDPLSTVCFKLGEMIYSLVSAKRIKNTLDYPEQDGNEDVKLNNYDVVFDHISFAYDSDYVIKDVSFVAKQGEITALVGPSGCGKSTLCKLASRFWDVTKGRIMIDGKNINEIAPETLLQYFSIVFQDVVLFNDTIYNNIKIGKKDATKEEIIAAAKLAQCEEFIDKLPDGYDTLIGENGKTLSGGERQRLSIARAFLKDAPIILLDESTASLDPENETLVQQAIGRLIKDKTVLIIAHRLRSVEECDKIIALKEGRIEESGTHAELMKNKGLYSHLYNLQKETMEWGVSTTNIS